MVQKQLVWESYSTWLQLQQRSTCYGLARRSKRVDEILISKIRLVLESMFIVLLRWMFPGAIVPVDEPLFGMLSAHGRPLRRVFQRVIDVDSGLAESLATLDVSFVEKHEVESLEDDYAKHDAEDDEVACQTTDS